MLVKFNYLNYSLKYSNINLVKKLIYHFGGISLSENKIQWITRTAILLAVALVFQLGGFPQPISGPVVNTVLYLAAMIVGMSSGIVIGIFTPLVAFMTGIMGFPPMIPFIAAGNALLVIVFVLLKKYHHILGIVAASFFKFILLAASIRLLANFFLENVPEPIIQAMSLPQLFTALAGGVLALIVYKALEAVEFI